MVLDGQSGFLGHAHLERGKICNFPREWSREANEGTKMCGIVTLVGVEHIIESISRKLIKLIGPRPSGAWENCDISVRCYLRVQMSAANGLKTPSRCWPIICGIHEPSSAR